MATVTTGIHHISAITGDAQETIDFYYGVLGLYLVKQTLEKEDPGTYNLYFGNETGEPGTLLIMHTWGESYPGQVGDGQVAEVTFKVPTGSLSFWEKRLAKKEVPYKVFDHFERPVIRFKDPFGMTLNIVESETARKRKGSHPGVSEPNAIDGFSSVTLYTTSSQKTSDFLEHAMGYNKSEIEKDLVRFTTPDDAHVIDMRIMSEGRGLPGVGTFNHVAFGVISAQDLLTWKQALESHKYMVSLVQDETYFQSIAFHEPGEVLFKLATIRPGLSVDEPIDALGEEVIIPEPFRRHKEDVLSYLAPLERKKEV